MEAHTQTTECLNGGSPALSSARRRAPSADRRSDRVLADLAARGDKPAFGELYERHRPRLLAICRRLVGPVDAEDVMQQAFLAAFLALTRRGHRPAEPDRWLRAIARNQCFSTLRARKCAAPIRDELDGSTRTPYDEVACRTEVRGMMADLGRLPSEQRSALVLAELDEIPHAAIAEELDCRPSKVKALVFQARESLGAFRDARDLPCGVVRAQLEEARVGRPRACVTRHLKVCPDCEEFARGGRHS